MTKLGNYTLLHRLARGGMAEVFLARVDGPMGFAKKCVVKRILPQLTDDPRFVEMFLAEAKLAAQLSHPNVVHVFDFGHADGQYYLAMELIEGVNARELRREYAQAHGHLDLALAARLTAMAAEGLHYAHELRSEHGEFLNLVHRDVSPDNILVSHAGAVKIVDFGIAKVISMASLTLSGTVKGKVAYMSPEQLAAEPLDRRADLYSLGVVLFELVTGRLPFDSVTEHAAIETIMSSRPFPRASTIRPDCPRALDAIIARCIEKRRGDRYETCADVQTELEFFVASAGAPKGTRDLAAVVEEVRARRNALTEAVEDPPTEPRVDTSNPTTPARPMHLRKQLGEAFGPYRLLGPLASGGMAELLLAVRGDDASFQQTFAVKRVHPHFTDTEEFVRLFTNEAKLNVRLEHPNIVRVTDFGDVEGQLYLAMEYLPGEDLSHVLREVRRRELQIPIDIALTWCAGIGDGLAHAHRMTDVDGTPLHLIHRDVSPSNVVVTYQGATKLVDFGVARVASVGSTTKTGSVRGKPAYIAPECFEGKPFDSRIDVWSLGCVAWELLAGRRLFTAPDDAALIGAVLAGPIPRLDEITTTVDSKLADIVQRALERSPERRFQTADEFSAAIDAYLARQRGRATPRAIATWMTELFGAERANAKLHVASGTKLEAALPLVLKRRNATAPSVQQELPAPRVQRLPRPSPLLVAGLIVGLLLALAGVIALNVQSAPSGGPQVTSTTPTSALSVSLESTPPGASVFVDDRLTGMKTPTQLRNVPKGVPLRIRVVLTGYEPLERRVIPSDAEGVERFVLVPSRASVQVLGVPPGATVLVDGVATSMTGETMEVSLGVHTFQLQVDGRVTATLRANITESRSTVAFR